MDPSMFAGGLGSFLGGMFGSGGNKYNDAMKEYQQWIQRAQGMQNPFYNAGVGAMGNYQNWLNSMKDPSAFINNLMSKYQESPWAKFQQQQGMRMANNMGSATGMTGSTPLMQQAQQNAQNISSGDMNTWLQNVLGINSQYGAGEGGLMGMGADAANAMSGLYGKMAPWMGEQAYNRSAAGNDQFWNTVGGAAEMAGAFL